MSFLDASMPDVTRRTTIIFTSWNFNFHSPRENVADVVLLSSNFVNGEFHEKKALPGLQSIF